MENEINFNIIGQAMKFFEFLPSFRSNQWIFIFIVIVEFEFVEISIIYV
jgi:hypothetical protein